MEQCSIGKTKAAPQVKSMEKGTGERLTAFEISRAVKSTFKKMGTIREDAGKIIENSISAVLPEAAVKRALAQKDMASNLVLVAIGKASWNMAAAAKEILGNKIKKGIVITKYGHAKGEIEGCEIIEAGHPVPDENSVKGASRALQLVSELESGEEILFLISGGGSSLFEKPMEGVSLEDIQSVTDQLLKSGANIREINTIRKHLSEVKGGRFAQKCSDHKIFSIVLSDVLGDSLDTIASGPAYPDKSTVEDALQIIDRYGIRIEKSILHAISQETPKTIENVDTVISGSVRSFCEAAAMNAALLGYSPLILTTSLDGEAREAGSFFAAMAREIAKKSNSKFTLKPPLAIIAGGETIVRVKGNGKGGRNQEAALAAANGIEGLENTVIFSVGSDGTDGPTDAAGGLVDGGSVARMIRKGQNPAKCIDENNSYEALKASNDLIITGPTGTNVNDILVLLCKE